MGEEFEVESPRLDSKESSGQDTVRKLLLRRGSLSWAHHGRLLSYPVSGSGVGAQKCDGAFLTSASFLYSFPHYRADILG